MLGFIVKLFALLHEVRDVWEWLNFMHVQVRELGAVMSWWGFQSVRYLEVKVHCTNAFNLSKDSVRCSEFGGGRFSEVANVYYKYGVLNL